jgi:hypothetical protein
MTQKANQDNTNAAKKKYPRLNFRVNEDERAKIESDAAAHSLTTGSYLRWLTITHPRTRAVRRPMIEEKLLAQLKAEAGRVDGNLAQLLRLANRGEIVLPEEIEDAAQAVRDFYVEAREILKRAK